MFDAFHHLERPEAFVAWLAARTSRCLLIEPAGTWSGRWSRGIDVDWLLADLASVRERLEAVCGERDALPELAAADSADAPGTGAARADRTAGPPPPQGEGAIERRYALDDFARFFAGWHLRITGTVAGIDRYPPGAHARSALRPIAGELAYTLLRATDALLFERGRDGAAKHWVVAASTEAGVLEARLPPTTVPAPIGTSPASRVASAYDVRYADYDGPVQVDTGAEFRVTVDVENIGWNEWRSDGVQPVHVSYHWLSLSDEMVEFDGLRSDLPGPIGPGATGRASVTVRAPATRGAYRLTIDLVREGVTWFSEAGAPGHTVRIEVR